jgi:hypothetical protein
MRAWIGALGLVALVGCGEPPPCGVDQDGEDVPYCEVTFPDLAEPLAFCPLEHWAASDACNTCGCSEEGLIICTSLPCGLTDDTDTTGTSDTSDTGVRR